MVIEVAQLQGYTLARFSMEKRPDSTFALHSCLGVFSTCPAALAGVALGMGSSGDTRSSDMSITSAESVAYSVLFSHIACMSWELL